MCWWVETDYSTIIENNDSSVFQLVAQEKMYSAHGNLSLLANYKPCQKRISFKDLMPVT